MWFGSIRALDEVLSSRQTYAKEKLSLERELESVETPTQITEIIWLRAVRHNVRTSKLETLQELAKSSSAQVTQLCLLPTLLALVASMIDSWAKRETMMKVLFTATIPITSFLLYGGNHKPDLIVVVVISQVVSAFAKRCTTWWLVTMAITNIISPLVYHVYEDISDETEIRWILFGLLYDLIYVLTLEVMALAHRWWLFSILFALWSILIASVVAVAIYDQRLEPGAHLRPQPLLLPTSRLSSIYRWALQLCIFPLNRLTKAVLREVRRINNKENNVGYQALLELPRYIYQELRNSEEANKGTFRLLRILQGTPDQGVNCRLETITSPDDVEYEAISYVWGKPPFHEVDLRINDSILAITESAFDIIRRRQSPYKDRLIWIDQVCINQKNITEREFQVQIMKDIYQSASSVVAYLGPATDAYLLQAHFAELYWRQEMLGYTPEQLQASYRYAQKAAQWDAQLDFFAHPWFRRAWIIQEAVFAKKLMLLYGDVCLDWIMVSRVLNVLFDNKILGTPQTNDPMIFSQKRNDYQAGLHNLDSVLELRGDVNYGQAFDLAHVLEMSARSSSTDPRDKIYAILGLTADSSSVIIKPDYGEFTSTAIVYTRAIRFILERCSNPLNALRVAGIGYEQSPTILNLPSWVPDWSQTGRIFMVDSDYTAGKVQSARILFSAASETELILEGNCFDRVGKPEDSTAVFEMQTTWTLVDADVYQDEWFRSAENIAERSGAAHYRFLPTQSTLEAFVRTLTGDHRTYRNPGTVEASCQDDYDSFKLFSQLKQQVRAGIGSDEILSDEDREGLDQLDASSRRFSHLSGPVIMGKRFCITQQGRFAVIPPYCKNGDVVCILQGARVPYVMRQGPNDHWKIVGSCYVHGAMYGECSTETSEMFLIE